MLPRSADLPLLSGRPFFRDFRPGSGLDRFLPPPTRGRFHAPSGFSDGLISTRVAFVVPNHQGSARSRLAAFGPRLDIVRQPRFRGHCLGLRVPPPVVEGRVGQHNPVVGAGERPGCRGRVCFVVEVAGRWEAMEMVADLPSVVEAGGFFWLALFVGENTASLWWFSFLVPRIFIFPVRRVPYKALMCCGSLVVVGGLRHTQTTWGVHELLPFFVSTTFRSPWYEWVPGAGFQGGEWWMRWGRRVAPFWVLSPLFFPPSFPPFSFPRWTSRLNHTMTLLVRTV